MMKSRNIKVYYTRYLHTIYKFTYILTKNCFPDVTGAQSNTKMQSMRCIYNKKLYLRISLQKTSTILASVTWLILKLLCLYMYTFCKASCHGQNRFVALNRFSDMLSTFIYTSCHAFKNHFSFNIHNKQHIIRKTILQIYCIGGEI